MVGKKKTGNGGEKRMKNLYNESIVVRVVKVQKL